MNSTQKIFQDAIAQFQLGNIPAAAQLAEEVLELSPDFFGAAHFLGFIEMQRGQFDKAVQLISAAIEKSPDVPTYHYSLGCALYKGNHLEKSLAALDRAIQLDPQLAEAFRFRGLVLFKLGRLDEALVASARAVQLGPDAVAPRISRGDILRRLGCVEEALAEYDGALRIDPGHSGAHVCRGDALRGLGHFHEALKTYDDAIRLSPDLPEAHNNRGNVLTDLGRLNEALEAYNSALSLKPGYAGAHFNCGNLLRDLGYYDKAEQCYRRAIELDPSDADVHSSLLYLLAARAQLSPEEMLHEQRKWNDAHGGREQLEKIPTDSTRKNPGERIRIGYVSPDFRKHVVSYFFEPLLAAHDRSEFEIFCYDANVRPADAVNRHLRSLAEHWRPVAGKGDYELAQLIRDDSIDILVDLAGHTRGNRLKAFTYRPAPVQASYLGFFAATGLDVMDYWITDQVLHPPDTTEVSVESIYRLPRCSFCYRPPSGTPAVSPGPGAEDKVTFGSFGNLSKLGPELIETWSDILKALPGCRLLLMDKPLTEQATRDLLTERFAQHGVSPEQLMLREGVPFEEYMNTYSQVDIVLDSFPRTGGTTTAEALWMGVPVVTLAGQRYAERISASKLTAVGLEDLVTTSRQEYVKTAISLVRDASHRRGLRKELRNRMVRSVLCDGEGIARAMEEAYKVIWKDFTKKSSCKAGVESGD